MAYEFHFYEAILNEAGDGLPNYFAQVVDPVTLAPISIAADAGGTPIVTDSGVANMARTDKLGNLSFWVSPGSYNLMIYRPDAQTFVHKVDGYPMGVAGAADLIATAFAARDDAAAQAAAAAAAVASLSPLLAALPNLPSTSTANALIAALLSQSGTVGRKQTFDWNGGTAKTITDSGTITGITGVTIDGLEYETDPANFTVNLGTKTVTPTTDFKAAVPAASRITIKYQIA